MKLFVTSQNYQRHGITSLANPRILFFSIVIESGQTFQKRFRGYENESSRQKVFQKLKNASFYRRACRPYGFKNALLLLRWETGIQRKDFERPTLHQASKSVFERREFTLSLIFVSSFVIFLQASSISSSPVKNNKISPGFFSDVKIFVTVATADSR